MEESNNNEKEETKSKKNINKVKNRKKAILRIIKFSPYISLLIICALVLGLINYVFYTITSLFSSQTSVSNPTQTNNTIKSIISLDENGAYKINTNFSNQILEMLESKHINPEYLGFINKTEELQNQENSGNIDNTETIKEIDDMIDKYIKAEMQTMFPQTSQLGNDMDGVIKIYRTSKSEPLEYIKKSGFEELAKKYQTTGDTKILKYFSLTEDFKLLIAREGNSRYYLDVNGNSITTEDSYSEGLVIDEIDYQTSIQNYATPFNFFLTLHLVSRNNEFMNELVDLVIGNEESIVLTYVESSIQTTTEKKYDGTCKTVTTTTTTTPEPTTPPKVPIRDVEKIQLYAQNNSNNTQSITESKETTSKMEYGEIEKYVEIPFNKEVSITNTGELHVTKAETWLKKCNKIIEKINSNPIPEQEYGPNTIFEDNFVVSDSSTTNPDTQKTVNTKITQYIKIDETLIITPKSNNYTIVNDESDIIVDKEGGIIDLIKKYPKVETKFTTTSNTIFYMLQQDESTQQLELVMRYIISKLTGIDDKLTKDDLMFLLADNQFIYVSSSDIFRQYSRYWENPQITADEEHYIIKKDENGNLVAGYGIKLEENKEILEDAGYILEEGKEIDKDVIDGLEEAKITEITTDVKDITKGENLTTYQVNALVSRSYDKGAYDTLEELRGSPSMNFVDSYKTYWKQEDNDMFKKDATNEIFEHELYTQYMSGSSNATDSQNMQRRMSEWILFCTGYYREINQWQSSNDDILDAAEQIHYYMEQHKYTYCVYGGNNYEECNKLGKSHGLNSTFEASMTGHQNTCCATFVSWVLQEAGYITEKEHTREGLNSATNMRNFLKQKGWTVIYSVSELQPGDILCYDGHVDIYAGDNTKYNAGSGEAIRRRDSPYKTTISGLICGLRAPNK